MNTQDVSLAEPASVRGADKLTAFRESEPVGTPGWQPHPCQKQRRTQTVPGAQALPWKMHLSFKKEKKLVFAAGTAGNLSLGAGTAAGSLLGRPGARLGRGQKAPG